MPTPTTTDRVQHTYHHHEPAPTRLNISVERNTKGYNWTITVTGAATLNEALSLITQADTALRTQYASTN